MLLRSQTHFAVHTVFPPSFLKMIFAGSVTQFSEYGIKFSFDVLFRERVAPAILDFLTTRFNKWSAFSTFGVAFVYHGNRAFAILDKQLGM